MNIKLLRNENISDLEYLMNLLDIYYSSNKKDRNIDAKKFIEKKQAYGYFSNNKLIGYILIEYFDQHHYNFPNSIFLSELFVLDKHRRKKIGFKLVKYILNLKYPSVFSNIFVTHSPKEKHLKDFYEKCGFKLKNILDSGNIALFKKN